ncbi:MAG TPA: penicillin-binding protein 2 [Anaerolineales bacterium]|nr:penicillin-binding protein 2 [Anaerolineales bacterium]
MRQQYAWRSKVLTIVLGLIAFAVLAQIVRIQNSQEAAIFKQQGNTYASELETFYPDRGEIYDRNGHLLAGNKTVYEIGVDLATVKDAKAIAMAVSVELGLDYNQLYQQITNPSAGISYVVLADYVAGDKAAALQQLKVAADNQAPQGVAGQLSGLEFKAHPQRSYPEGALASNILGFVNREGRGYFGVEEKYNDLLAGNPVQVLVPTDPNKAFEIPHVPDGTTLVLTINRDLQAAAEKILDDSLTTYSAQGGTIIVMDPKTGELLAIATTPRMDLNQFWNYGSIYDNASEFDPAVSMPYEPGSVMKILTMAAALDSGTVVPSTPFLDTGAIMVGGATIRNWDDQAWGQQDMIGCLQHSLNVCLAWVSTQMGAQTFYGYMNRFGLGRLTGVDLAGEAAGRLKVPGDGDWYPVDLATNAFGQGVAATPIQVMMATSAVADDGRMVVPHVLYSMLRDGRQYNVPPQYAGTPITPDTANTLNNMLAISLENESSEAMVPGYRIAGKTGTAQIPTPLGVYDSTYTNASFIGWGPVDDPKFMIYVWLEKPSASIWGSETAAPVFAQIAEKTVVLLNIPPDNIRKETASQ